MLEVLTPQEADAVAVRAHGDDRTRLGVPFIEHVRRVAARMRNDRDPYAVPAALLHDAVEKGSLDWGDLRAAGADDRLIAVVDALTERESEPAERYLARCAADPLASRIKRADLLDKLTTSRERVLPGVLLSDIHEHARQRLQLLEQLAAELGADN